MADWRDHAMTAGTVLIAAPICAAGACLLYMTWTELPWWLAMGITSLGAGFMIMGVMINSFGGPVPPNPYSASTQMTALDTERPNG